MDYRQFGATDMKVSVLGFGGAEIGFRNADQDIVNTLLNSALDAGLNVIDTAECYNESETKIGEAISHRRDKFHLFTKCGHASGFDLPDWSPEMLRQSIDRSLKRLRTDHVDLLQLHSCDKDLLEKGEVIEVILEAKKAGKTRYVGYSGDGENAVFAVNSGVFDSLQTSINIADQQVLELALPLARSRNMGVIAKRPLANVAWGSGDKPRSDYERPYWERLNELNYEFLDNSIDSAVATALRFTLSQPGVHTAIVGTTNPTRWAANAEHLLEGGLPLGEIQAIRDRWAQVAKPDWVGQQ